MNKLGSFIRSKREQNHLLLRHLAAKLDMDVAYLSKLERGERIARFEHLQPLSDILDVSASDLQLLWTSDQITNLLSSLDTKEKAIKALDMTKQEILQPN